MKNLIYTFKLLAFVFLFSHFTPHPEISRSNPGPGFAVVELFTSRMFQLSTRRCSGWQAEGLGEKCLRFEFSCRLLE